MSWFTKVANKAKDALSQAVILASTPIYDSDQDEFHSLWQRILTKLGRYPIELGNGNTPISVVQDATLREWLHRLVALLEAEDNAISDYAEIHLLSERKQQELGLHSPRRRHSQQEQPTHACLEYLLEKQIVSWLCDAGLKDSPPGMMAVSLEFAGQLLARVQYPLLPTTEIRVALLKLITCAARKEIEDLQVREQLLNVLHTLWCKLRGDHVQIEVFFHRAERLTCASSAGNGHGHVHGNVHDNVHDNDNGANAFDGWDASNQEMSELLLFTALLPHMFANGVMGTKCREALCIAASSRDLALIRFVLGLTPFCHYVVNGIISAFEALPKLPYHHHHHHQHTQYARNHEDVASSSALPLSIQLQELATRVRFCCTLAMVGTFEAVEQEFAKTTSGHAHAHAHAHAHPHNQQPHAHAHAQQQQRSMGGISITLQLLQHFVTRFLCGNLLEGLLHTSESIVLTNLHYARIVLEELLACGQDLQTNPLLRVYLEFLLVNFVPQRVNGGILNDLIALDKLSATRRRQEQDQVRDIQSQLCRLAGQLVRHMNSMSSALSVEAMDLFETMLSVQDGWLDQVLMTDTNTLLHHNKQLGSSSSSMQKSQDKSNPSEPAPENTPKHTHFETVTWLASRFPGSQVATYGNLWKKSDFGTMPLPKDFRFEDEVTPGLPTSVEIDPVASVLGYIADAEFAMCRLPLVREEEDEGDDDDDNEDEENSLHQDMESDVHHGRTRRLSRTCYDEDLVRLYFTPLKRLDLMMHLPAFTPVSLKTIQPQTALAQVKVCASATSSSSSSSCEPSSSPRGADSPRNQHQSTIRTDSADSADNTAGAKTTDSESCVSSLPVFHRIILNRVERILENSLMENLAISGIVSALAKRAACHEFVFDHQNVRGRHSVRAILEEVYEDGQRRIARLANGATMLQNFRRQLLTRPDWHELEHLTSLDTSMLYDPSDVSDASSSGGVSSGGVAAAAAAGGGGGDPRLFLGMAFLDEFLKELCSILFCKQKVMMLPVKPEGFYMQPKLAESHMTHVLSSSSLSSELALLTVTSPTRVVVQEKKEMEGMFATAKLSLDNILHKV